MKDNNQSSDAIVEIELQPGNLGNKMLQYMAAVKLANRIGSTNISSIRIPEFGIDIARTTKRTSPLRVRRYQSKVSARLNFDDISAVVARDNTEKVVLNIYSSVFENLPSLDISRSLFPLKPGVSGYGEDTLLINVRAAEILNAIHPEYTVIPADFYEEVIAETGLQPVFLGQVAGESKYLNHLKDRFPKAEFVPSQGALHDFSVIARSKNIVIAVSTFSWLAGWLSQADRIIMPLSGFMNPFQYPQADLIPADDKRFSYYLFPKNYAVKDEHILDAHRSLSGTWRKIDEEEAQRIKSQSQVSPVSSTSSLRLLARSGKNYLSKISNKLFK